MSDLFVLWFVTVTLLASAERAKSRMKDASVLADSSRNLKKTIEELDSDLRNSVVYCLLFHCLILLLFADHYG